MMDLIERYLAAVRRNLPARDADDIVAELREALLERAEAREEATGQALGRDGWEALLVEFGHPLAVAARYRGQQWLIGPELYPFYLHFLKMIGGIVAAVVAATAAFRGATHQGLPGPWIVELLGGLWWGLAGTVGSVTIVFALIERYGGVARHFRAWRPRDLPQLADRQPRAWESMFEVALGLGFVLWWTGALPLPGFVHLGAGELRLEPAPIWAALYWPILVLAVARLALDLVKWLRPGWKALRWLLGIATAIGGLALLARIYQAGHWVTAVSASLDAERLARLQQSLDLSLRIAFVAVAIGWTLQCLIELWRLTRSPRG